MKVLLRKTNNSHYHAGNNQWTVAVLIIWASNALLFGGVIMPGTGLSG